MSGLNKIKESMYYHNYISDETYDEILRKKKVLI